MDTWREYYPEPEEFDENEDDYSYEGDPHNLKPHDIFYPTYPE